MSGELERMHGDDLFRGPGARGFSQEIRDVYRRAATTRAGMDCLAAVTWVAMNNTVKLEQMRRELAGNDNVFNTVTGCYMSSYFQQMQQLQAQAGGYSMFGGNAFGRM